MAKLINDGKFKWDEKKAKQNLEKHKLAFEDAIYAFLDSSRIIAVDEMHSKSEPRYFCIEKVDKKVATVRFTTRGHKIRIIGAGFWRKGRKFYEEENKK